jgi:hypothetical protein
VVEVQAEEASPRTMEAVMKAAVTEVQEMKVPADSQTNTEAPVVLIVEVMMNTKETDVGQVETRDAEMTVMRESSRDVLSTRCQD